MSAVSATSSSSDTTSLATAALEGDEAGVRRALAEGASVDACDEHGWTALHNAMLSGTPCLAIARMLVRAGASCTAVTDDGLSPLHLVHEVDPKVDWKVSRGATADGRSSFFAPSLIQLLIDGGARVNAPSSDGRTPLHRASEAGASSSVMALLHCGADVHHCDHRGRTALQLAGTGAARPLTSEHALRLRGLIKAAADGTCNAEGYSLCGAPVRGEALLADPRVDESDSDEESDSWTAALAAVPTQLPTRLYGPPPTRPPPLSPACDRRPPLSPPRDRRPPLSPPSRKRTGSHANIAAGVEPASLASPAPTAGPKTPKSSRLTGQLENFTL